MVPRPARAAVACGMTYTLWLHDRLLGETDLPHTGPMAGQRLGGLRPTPAGLETLPGLCGFLGAASAMKEAMRRRGITDPEADPEAAYQAVRTTEEGRRFTAIVGRISQLELRDAHGAKAPFHTISVTDLYELGALVPTMDVEGELAAGSPRYIVSAMPGAQPGIRFAPAGVTTLKLQWHPN